jgi:hypothetical protein
MSVTLTVDDALARVRLVATVGGTVAYAVIDRSTNDVRWTTVRGGSVVVPASLAVRLDDYEFPPGVATTYRVRSYTSGNALVSTETAVITASITRVWLKSVARPFLNRPVVLMNRPEISARSRNGRFDIKGRSLPIVVSEVRGPAEWTLRVRTADAADTRALELMLASGDVLCVQAPADVDDVPTGHVDVGDTSRRRVSALAGDRRQDFVLSMTEVAAPGADVVGVTATWDSVKLEFATWNAVKTEFATWADLLEHVADPETVIVP